MKVFTNTSCCDRCYGQNLCSDASPHLPAALVPCAPSFLGGLPEWLDPLTSPLPLARCRPCGRRCSGFKRPTEHKITGAPHNLCRGALSPHLPAALVPCAPSFLGGLLERVDPLRFPLPPARCRPCGRRCNGFQFPTERKSQDTCLSVHWINYTFIISVLILVSMSAQSLQYIHYE